MNIDKIKKDSKYEFDNLCKFFDNDENNIKECFYYLLFKDLIQIKDDEYKKMSSKDYVENNNSILLHYLDNIYFKISNNQPELLPILKENIIKKNNEIKLKLIECESHMNILKKAYDNILLLEYLPITNDIKFMFENKTVLTITEPEKFNIILSEFIARYIFSTINQEKNINFNKTNEKENRLKDIFDPTNFYSSEKINSYIDNNDKIVGFNLIDNNFKYWYVLITLIGQIISKNSKYEIIFNKIEREKYIKNILTPKKENNKKKNLTKKKKFFKKSGGGNKKKINHKKLKSVFLEKLVNPVNNEKITVISKISKIPTSISGKTLLPSTILKNSSTIKKGYENIFSTCIINGENFKKKYIDSYKKNIKNYFNTIIDKKSENKYNKDSEFINPFNGQIIKLNKIINLRDKEYLDKDELKTRINEGEIIFDIFEFLYNYLLSNNIKEIDDFVLKVKKRLILILYKLYEIKSVIYKNYILIINSLFDLNTNTKKNNIKSNNTIEIKKLNNKKNNNLLKNIIIKKQIEQNILNNSSINITVKIKLLTNKILELNSKQSIVHYDMEKLELEDQLKKLIIEKYNKKHNKT